jgi:diamine N-acetyltransferase
VSKENWYDCTQLQVTAQQLHVFPAPVVYWIAESKYMAEFSLLSIYSEETLAGMIVYCTEPDENGHYWIPALMIDAKQQGNGYGKQALIKLIELMRQTLNCKTIMIGHRPENHIAAHLYESLGFHKVSDELIDGEIVRLLRIS